MYLTAAKDPTETSSNSDNYSEKDSVADPTLGLFVNCYRSYLSEREQKEWWDLILENTDWFRVKYCSGRYAKDCTTPCYTNFFGGVPGLQPYQPIPAYLQPLVDRVSRTCKAPFNSFLLRLYIDGNDTIAWHTDGRTFLGPSPVIASLSLGAPAKFEMRRMTNVWPCSSTPGGGIDKDTPQRKWTVASGDMLVMLGSTQQHWHHRVPQERYRQPRVNINFRYILPNDPESQRGQQTFFKYMVCGDHHDAEWNITAPSWKYADIIRSHSASKVGIENLFAKIQKRSRGETAIENKDDDNATAVDGDSSVENSASATKPATAASHTYVQGGDGEPSETLASASIDSQECSAKRHRPDAKKSILHFFASVASLPPPRSGGAASCTEDETQGKEEEEDNEIALRSRPRPCLTPHHKTPGPTAGAMVASGDDAVGISREPSAPASPPEPEDVEWNCSICTFVHAGAGKRDYLSCEMCGAPRE